MKHLQHNIVKLLQIYTIIHCIYSTDTTDTHFMRDVPTFTSTRR